MSPQLEDRLLKRIVEENVRGQEFVLPVHFDLSALLSLVATLQVALRHPEMKGPTAERVQNVIASIIQRLKEEGFEAHAELMLLGNDPQYDQPRRPA